MNRLKWTCLVALVALCGCQNVGELQTRYGRISRERESINGLSILAEKFEQRGMRVRSRSRISPTIENYDTIVWAPEQVISPSEAAIERLNQWLLNGYGRTLVFIAGAYSAEEDYFEQVFDAANPASKEEILRLIAEQKIVQQTRIQNRIVEAADCDWFTVEFRNDEPSAQLGGAWADLFSDSQAPALPLGVLLKPVDEPPYGIGQDLEVLLTVDQEPLVFEYAGDGSWEGDLLIVANGSFLLNFSLAIEGRERLADQLVNHVAANGGTTVLFLESGPEPIDISDSDYENHNSWAWVAEKPFRYIVPHCLFWGTLFCFTFFPIFGRARNTRKPSSTSFRNHIRALAKQLERTSRSSEARERIRHYQDLVGPKSKGQSPK